MNPLVSFVLVFGFLSAVALKAAPPHVVLLQGENEYGSAQTLPALAEALASELGYDTTVLRSPEDTRQLPDLAALEDADLLLLHIRFREPTEQQAAQLKAYFDSGRPAIAFRTTSHGFWEDKGWFVPLFGGHYKAHAPNGPGTLVATAPGAENHPILDGVAPEFHVGYGGTYNAQPLSDFTQALLMGRTQNLPAEPVAWIARPKEGQRLFYTSLGAEDNFASPHFQKLIQNACQWCLGKTSHAPPATTEAIAAPPQRTPAADATVLFDGTDLSQWRHWDPSTFPQAIGIDQRADTTSGGPLYENARWQQAGRALIARPGYGDILSKATFGDAVYEFDFLIPQEPEGRSTGFRGNSGVFIDGKWEIQIIDSYGQESLDDELTCGAIFGVAAPSVNACAAPGTWQRMQVAVQHLNERAADLSVWLNGTQIHDRVRVENPTVYGFLSEEESEREEDDEDDDDRPAPEPWFVSSAAQGKQCDMGKDFTVVMRFRTEESGPLFGKLLPDARHREGDKVLFIEEGRLHYDIGWVGAIDADPDVTDGAWHTVALRSQDGHITLFLDGEKVAEKENFTAPDNKGSVLRLGAGARDFPDDDRHWEGDIEGFQFFAEALSDQDLELTGASEPIERVQSIFAWSGEDGRARRMVKGDDAKKLDLGKEYSVAVRFRTYESGPLFSKAPASGKWEPNGKVLFVQGDRLVYDIGWLGALQARGMKVNDGNWHIAVVTHKEGRTRLYVDGKRVAQNRDFTRPDNEDHVFKVGACAVDFPPGPERFPGHLSQVIFFGKELRQREVFGISEGDFDEEAVLFYHEDETLEDEALAKPEREEAVEEAEEAEESEEEELEQEGDEEEREKIAVVGAPLRLQADSANVRFANVFVRPLADVDHASILRQWDDTAFARGQKIYQGICFACHGNLQQAGSLPTSRPFWQEPFKNGKDPYSLYLTMKNGFNQMPPQPWLTPSAAYDVIHYIREEFVKEHNPTEYTEITADYLDSLPKGMGTEAELTQEQIDYARGPKYLRMNFGPMLNWTFQVAPGNIAYKAIAIRLDEGPGGVSKGRHWMVYDHDTLRVAAAWSGNAFVDWKGIAFDQSHGTHTSIVGDKMLVNPVGPGWAHPVSGTWTDPRFLGRDGKPYGPLPRDWAQFKGQYIHGNRIVLHYTVGDAAILESPTLVDGGSTPVFARTLNIGKSSHDLRLRVSPADVNALVAGGGPANVAVEDGYQVMTVAAADTPLRVQVLSSRGDAQALFIASLIAGEAEDLSAYMKGGAPHWTETVTTEGQMGNDNDAFAVDEITYPNENPWHSWMRIGGFDFLPGGDRAAVATWLGDVWIVDGLKGDFSQHRWKRICTGLFQPLGVKWVDGHIYVTCRDQLAKLHDLNGDEEIDFIECFNNDHQVTEHFHEFAMGLQVDEKGNFYYAKSARHAKTALVPHHGTLLRVSPDGSKTDILATGFRAANGVCLNPDGTYIVTDQEGHWNPKNRINYVKEGGFYGNMYGYHDVTDSSDDAMEQPLCWITNAFDRSPGELLWVPKDAAWGGLNGSLLNLSYGMGRIFAVPHEKMANGQAQGGMVSLGLNFPTGIMRGRFHPENGQLYATGMFAWAGNKHQDGGFYRIRATGKAKNLPVQLEATAGGLRLGFTDPLDRATATQPANYRIKVWSLKRTKNYGSRHFDERPLEVSAATLSDDARTVFLTLPEIAPTWCMEIQIEVKDAEGREFKRVIHNTIHQLGGDASQTSVAPHAKEPVQEEIALDVNQTRAHASLLLEQHCMECHDSSVSKGDLDVETALAETPLVKNRALWINVLERLKNKEMPPPDETQPSAEDYEALIAWVDREVLQFDYSQVKNPGYERARRLSHAEYNHTVRDLFGVNVRPADQFPHDLSGISGFANSANTLFIQPTLLERYLGAAEEVVEAAMKNPSAWSFAKDLGDPDLLERFLLFAYRRAPTDEEVKEITERFAQSIAKGASDETALQAAFVTTLISPHFLFRIEEAPRGAGDHRINSWELASRLSYFLWASMPDRELLELAEAGRLVDDEVLQHQVERMLRDPRSRALGEEFASQWLKFEHVGTRVRLDPIDSPWCTDTLMTAMRQESALFIRSLIQENRPIHALLTANYTYLNEELAAHYDIKGIHGDHMRRVTLNDSRRGGLLAHASILAVTSFPGRTSPVIRGKYILDDVLGTPPPPPPPDAGELEDSVGERRDLTLKEKLAIHRDSPQCAGCHSSIDPLGFALENYDWFGRYRERMRGQPIDSVGQLPNGRSFAGLEGLREVLVDERMPDLTRQLTRKLLSFGLGRQLEYYDEGPVQEIVKAVETDGYRFHSLIYGIVRSHPFQWKRLPNAEPGLGQS